MSILCLGEAIVDLICETPVESVGEADLFVPHFGGASANVALAAARAGAGAALAGGAGEAIAAGARDVRFSTPVASYTENFLGFPVGKDIPSGYYDPQKHDWVASDNGRVVKVLSTGGGIAALDIDGSGQAASGAALAALGITDAERQKLAELYQAGQTLWRVPLDHFSPHDYNFPWAPPAGSTGPIGGLPPPPPDNGCGSSGSIIGCEGQTLAEEVPLTGTPFALHYQSDRTPGYDDRLDIPLSGATLPPGLRQIRLRIYVAGRRFTESLTPAPNLKYTFTWDGKDAFGRRLQGRRPAYIKIGYSYDAVYTTGAALPQAFARFGSSTTGIAPSRDPEGFTFWLDQQATVGTWDARPEGLGGWTLDAHHGYDPQSREFFFGDGSRRSAQPLAIRKTAGTGMAGYSGDGGPATQAKLNGPQGLAAGPDGSLYIADFYNDRIRKVAPDGVITTVAGTGVGGYSGDGGQATQAQIDGPEDVDVGRDGSLYIADALNHRIRRVAPDGVITTVAGNGTLGGSGDGGPATQAQLAYPRGVAITADGVLYIADTNNAAVRQVDPNGLITTAAGSGNSSAENILATQAFLPSPEDVEPDPNGGFYIALTSPSHPVRRVGPDGRIKTVAGGNGAGFSGDGGPATAAQLRNPSHLAAAPDGSLYIADHTNERVRRVGPDGVITTWAGGGTKTGDDMLATQADLSLINGVALAPDGSLYLSDPTPHSIRRVSSPLPGFYAGSISLPSEDGNLLYKFDAAGRHLQTVDALTGGSLYRFAYDSAGRLATIEDGDGNVTTIERDANGDPTGILGPFGQRTTLALSDGGYLSRMTNPAGESTRFSYSGNGLLETFRDPRGNLSQMTYDSAGRLTRDEDAAGGAKSLSRADGSGSYTVSLTTGLGRASSYRTERLASGDGRRTYTDPSGLQSETRDNRDGTAQLTRPDGTAYSSSGSADPRFGMEAPLITSGSVRTPSGLQMNLQGSRTVALADPNDPLSLTRQTDTDTINGQSWTHRFDSSPTRRFTDTSPAGRVALTDLDSRRRPTRIERTGITPATYTYDVRGRLSEVAQGSRIWHYAYGSDGRVSSITDPASRIASFTYDQAGRLTRETLPDGRQIAYAYDANGNLTQVTPPSRPAHAFSHTPVNLTADYTAPQVGDQATQTRYAYNADRQPTSIVRPDGTTIAFAYDSGGRLSSITDPRGTTSYAYDAITGNLRTITAPGPETLTLDYDGALPTKETAAGTVSGEVSRTYSTDFRVASTAVNGTLGIGYTYDADGLLTGAGSMTVSRSAQNGLVTGTTLGSLTSSLSYNSFGEPSSESFSFSGSQILGETYTRDSLGRIESREEATPSGTQTYAYEYDQAGRLSAVRRGGQLIADYDYDQNGNRISETREDGTTLSATYDAQDRLARYGQTDYSYDRNGALASKTTNPGATTTYSYDAQGNLTHAGLPDGRSLDYVTDGRNRRIAKKIDGSAVQKFLYEADAVIPVAELDAQDNIASRFVYATRANVPDFMARGGATYRIVTDQLGSPRRVVDVATGSIAQEIDYDAFGNVTRDTSPGFQPFGFAGGLYDRDTKLVRFGARDYDPETGRWTAKDPILFEGGDPNLYGYVLNDAVNLIDPLGLMVKLGGGCPSFGGVGSGSPAGGGGFGGFGGGGGLGYGGFGLGGFHPSLGFTGLGNRAGGFVRAIGGAVGRAGQAIARAGQAAGEGVGNTTGFLGSHKRIVITGLHVGYKLASAYSMAGGCAASLGLGIAAPIGCGAVIAGTAAADRYLESTGLFEGSYLEGEE